MLAARRVKVVATIGPATMSRDALKSLIEAGLNVARLNFSHGSHEDHLQVIKHIRELSNELDAPVSILQDLQGPKIRVGKLENGKMELHSGEKVIITTDDILGKKPMIPTDFKSLPEDCHIGTKILLDDGLLELVVERIDGKQVHCEVVYGGLLKDRKGMNVPGANLTVDCMTEKDLKDLEFGLSHKLDYVALSFVRSADDMKRLRSLVDEKSPSTKLISKIEMLEAIDDLQAVIKYSDAVMVARGDLAIEVGQAQLPALQKKIIKECNRQFKPVITATQMLDSMVNNPRPTRAEVTDVANAILDGTDALMLSAETASGNYPVKCIQTMHEIAIEVESGSMDYYKRKEQSEFLEIAEAIAASACLTAEKLNATAIVCLTTTGKTATYISSFRPKARVFAVTHLLHTLNRLELVWGINTIKIDAYSSSNDVMDVVGVALVDYGICQPGDKIVLSLGMPVVDREKTNALRVYTIDSVGNANLDKSTLPLRFR